MWLLHQCGWIPPPHSKASDVTLSTNKIIERGVFEFSSMQPESGEANKVAAVGLKEQQKTVASRRNGAPPSLSPPSVLHGSVV